LTLLNAKASFCLLALALALALALGACGPTFDRQSELKSLRVLAVQKDKPYALPGETVNLSMLWVDASPKAGRPVQFRWLSGCTNPPGDLYQGCFPQLAGALAAQPMPLENDRDTYSFSIPDTIISDRKAPAAANQPVYGLSIVFFAVCAGELTFAPSLGASALPIECRDAEGKPLGSDDFVAGYTSVYSFQGFSNENPVFSVDPDPDLGTGPFEFRGQRFAADCVNEACLDAEAAPPSDDLCSDPTDVRCIPTCADDGDPTCPGHAFSPGVDALSAESDSVSDQVFGGSYQEQMWIAYYVDHGGVKSDVRLLNDATKGWNPNYGTQLYAPKEPGPVRIWAVVHDNRGGVSWSRFSVQAK
jgi:hypothetical protein